MAVCLAVLVMPVQPGSTSRAWHDRAVAAIKKFIATDDGHQEPFLYAYIVDAIGNTYGWNDPRVTAYLTKLRSMRHPDGGYGFNEDFDAFADGTVNDHRTTTYTITMADHVGPVLLDAYQHGRASAGEVRGIATYLLTKIPRIPVSVGTCLAYDSNPNDAKPGYCVHNVNAAVALFLSDLLKAGITVPGAKWLIIHIDQQETAAYLPQQANWRYMDGRPGLSDIDHTSLNVEWALSQSPMIGRVMLRHIMINDFPDDLDSPAAHFRLAAFDCTDGARWLGQFDQWLADPPNHIYNWLGQLARWASRNAMACDG